MWSEGDDQRLGEIASALSPDAPRVLLEAELGSHAYGLARPDSDHDHLAVHCAPLRQVLGLQGPQVVATSHVRTAPDRTSHELAKFVHLAAKANPTVLELLWATKYLVCTPAGRALIDARDAFLSTPAVRGAYGGFARAQLERIQRRWPLSDDDLQRSRIAKHARHARRLLLQGTELLSTGTVTLDVSSRRDLLFAAGERAVTDPAQFAAEFGEALAAFDATASVLPERPDLDRLDALVVAIRLGQIPVGWGAA